VKIINEYELNGDVTVAKLIDSGFEKVESKYLFYVNKLLGNIILSIFIPLDENKEVLSSEVVINLFDENFMQNVMPIDVLLMQDAQYAPDIIKNIGNDYNNKMNELVLKGIFNKVNNLEKENNLRK